MHKGKLCESKVWLMHFELRLLFAKKQLDLTRSHMFVWYYRCPAALLIEYEGHEQLDFLHYKDTTPEPSSHLVATICRACTRKRPSSHDPYLDIAVCRVKGMMIYKHACEISNRTVKVATDTSGRILCVDMNKISGKFTMSSVLYRLDTDCFNGSTSGKGLLVPQVSSCFI